VALARGIEAWVNRRKYSPFFIVESGRRATARLALHRFDQSMETRYSSLNSRKTRQSLLEGDFTSRLRWINMP
jgi:hypothetical protein